MNTPQKRKRQQRTLFIAGPASGKIPKVRHDLQPSPAPMAVEVIDLTMDDPTPCIGVIDLTTIDSEPESETLQLKDSYGCEYIQNFLPNDLLSNTLELCKNETYQIYPKIHKAFLNTFEEIRLLNRAPTIEFYIPQKNGLIPIYQWGQAHEAYLYGQPAPSIICDIAKRLNNIYGDHWEINHCLITKYVGGKTHFAPAHRDKTHSFQKDAPFFVLTLADSPKAERTFRLGKTDKMKQSEIVFGEKLQNNSLLFVTGKANEKLYHDVPMENDIEGERISIIFRCITRRYLKKSTEKKTVQYYPKGYYGGVHGQQSTFDVEYLQLDKNGKLKTEHLADIIAARELRIEEGMKSYDEDKRKLDEYNKDKPEDEQIKSVKGFRRMQRKKYTGK